MYIFSCFAIENGSKNATITDIQQAANGSDRDRDSPSDENSNGKTSPCNDEDIDFDERYQSLYSCMFK